MSTQYDDLQGTEMPAHEHPDSNMQGTRATQLAGDVVNFPISMKQSDEQRIKSMQDYPSGAQYLQDSAKARQNVYELDGSKNKK